MGDEIGKFGLERGWEGYLARRQAGGQEIEVDSVGRRLRVLNEIPETPGQSVVLTPRPGRAAGGRAGDGQRSGAMVAIDPNTGEILAMVSHPSFDPNMFRRRHHRGALARS